MELPRDYWASYEQEVKTLAEFFDAVQTISAYGWETDSRFVWRGAANAEWPLHSFLVREFEKQHEKVPTEAELRTFEAEVLAEAREDWGLDWHQSGGRLAALELLAALQHYEVPTRLLDFSFDPFIALWFAVEDEDYYSTEGRVFAIDISKQLVTRENSVRAEPWWLAKKPKTTDPWATQPWIWKPPPLEARVVRQEGCFLMGGVPSTQPARNVRQDGGWRQLRADEVRKCMSLPFQLIGYEQAEAAREGRNLPGAPPKARAFTLKIVGDKSDLKAELDRGFGLSHPSLFPDFPGLARYGRSFRA